MYKVSLTGWHETLQRVHWLAIDHQLQQHSSQQSKLSSYNMTL
jgi:hypothetical protein